MTNRTKIEMRRLGELIEASQDAQAQILQEMIPYKIEKPANFMLDRLMILNEPSKAVHSAEFKIKAELLGALATEITAQAGAFGALSAAVENNDELYSDLTRSIERVYGLPEGYLNESHQAFASQVSLFDDKVGPLSLNQDLTLVTIEGEEIKRPINVTLNIDGKELAKAVSKEIDKRSRLDIRYGGYNPLEDPHAIHREQGIK